MSAQLVFALDFPDRAQILDWAERLAPEVDWFKVGLEAYLREGQSLIKALNVLERPIFLDLKLHDIPNTVARAAADLQHLGVAMLTVHASGGGAMIKAACEALPEVAVVAVTVLTSLDEADLKKMGVDESPSHWAHHLAEVAIGAGASGLVSSGHELDALSSLGGLRVVPGVRPAGSAKGDQRRVVTPAQASESGATHVVVGRPIAQADDPLAVAASIRADLRRG